MGLDTIIFAVIAVLLLARLWAVFGRRNEEDKERPNPFIIPKQPPQHEGDAKFTSETPRPNEALAAFKGLGLAPASLAGGLQQIKELDPSFDEKQFLQGARQAFTVIIEDFSKGEMARITRLLGPDVLAQFQKAIEARRAAGQVMESKVVALKDVESKAARIEGSKAIISVRFVSDQENVLRDASSHIIGGEVGKSEEVIDLWSFARDTKSTDPNWLLVETHA